MQVHTDAAQAAGKIPVDVVALGVDLHAVVGHKMYAPKGVAALYVRPGLTLEPIIYDGGQEGSLRSGTENVALARRRPAPAVPELATSTGSACHSGTTQPSPVLSAMGLDHHRALSAVRLTLGRWTAEPDVDRTTELLTTAARHLPTRTTVEP